MGSSDAGSSSIDRAMQLGIDPTAALARITGRVRRTPVVESGAGAFGVEHSVAMKLDCLQHSGSFKVRGGFNSALASKIPEAGLIAASGGNHGQAVAYVARALGVPAEIFVPEAASPVKVRRISELGAHVRVVGALYDDARIACMARAAESGALDLHAYDQPLVVSGQATLAIELLEQVPDLDTVLVAVGGGGLAAGLASVLPASVKIVGVEPIGSRCFDAAVVAGRPIDVAIDSAAADSLGAKRVGSLTWEVIRDRVDPVVVADDVILETRRRMWDDSRIVVELGGATALAALVSGAYQPDSDERVAVIVCGGNTDPADLAG